MLKKYRWIGFCIPLFYCSMMDTFHVSRDRKFYGYFIFEINDKFFKSLSKVAEKIIDLGRRKGWGWDGGEYHEIKSKLNLSLKANKKSKWNKRAVRYDKLGAG
jgi:hypothetical protein